MKMLLRASKFHALKTILIDTRYKNKMETIGYQNINNIRRRGIATAMQA